MAKGLPAATPGRPTDFPTWYFDYVRTTLYDMWAQPSGVDATSGLSVEVTLRVHRDGSVSRKTITRRSGHAVLDQSVQSLLDSVSRFRPLPDTYRGAHRDITVSFTLTGL
jgi:TonB family protein